MLLLLDDLNICVPFCYANISLSFTPKVIILLSLTSYQFLFCFSHLVLICINKPTTRFFFVYRKVLLAIAMLPGVSTYDDVHIHMMTMYPFCWRFLAARFFGIFVFFYGEEHRMERFDHIFHTKN